MIKEQKGTEKQKRQITLLLYTIIYAQASFSRGLKKKQGCIFTRLQQTFSRKQYIKNKNRVKIEKKFMKEIQRCDYSITLMTVTINLKGHFHANSPT